jgi:hypothetical protein
LALQCCYAPPKKLDNFDVATWTRDKGGCTGARKNLLADFEREVKPLLLSEKFTEMQLIAGIGKADKIELAERGLKFYTYYIEPGSQCSGNTSSKEGAYIQIRLDAVNRVNEIAIVQ